MTKTEKKELKEKIKKVMIDHLNELGFPSKMNLQEILNEVKPMWIKLEEVGLIKPGMDFKTYTSHAENAATLAQMKEILGI